MYNLQRDPITLPRRVPRERDVRVDTARQLARYSQHVLLTVLCPSNYNNKRITRVTLKIPARLTLSNWIPFGIVNLRNVYNYDYLCKFTIY